MNTRSRGDDGQTPARPGNPLRDLARHTGVYAVGNMLGKVAGFLLLPLYTAYLSPHDYGVLEIVDTTAGMMGLILGFGMSAALGRFYFDSDDEDKRRRTFSTAVVLASAAAVVMVALGGAIAEPVTSMLFQDSVSASTLSWAVYGTALGFVVELGNTYLRITNQSLLYVSLAMANMIIGIGLNVYFLVVEKFGLMGILYSGVLTRLIVGVPPLLWILGKVGLRVDGAIARSMYRYGAPLMPSELASAAIGSSDRFFINGFLSTADAGIYGMAQKLGTALHYLVNSPFLTAFVVQRFNIGRNPDAPSLLTRAFRYHMAILIPLSCVLSLYASDMLRAMASANFQPAARYIPPATLAIILLASKYHFEYAILREKKTHLHMYVNLASAVLHAALNLLLIRWIGLWGALLASMVAFTAKSSGYLAIGRLLYPIPFPVQRTLLLLLLGYATVAVALVIAPGGWAGAAVKLPFVLLLAVLPVLIGYIGRQEIRAAAELVRRRLPGYGGSAP